jgi:hypothetical protein
MDLEKNINRRIIIISQKDLHMEQYIINT